jgi:hypothetical protein
MRCPMVELVAAAIMGDVFGGLIVAAWLSDGTVRADPTEHGERPL